MVSFDSAFCDEMKQLVNQLGNSPNATRGNNALERARSARTQESVTEIFKELRGLRDALNSSGKMKEREVSTPLNNLLMNEELRIQQASAKTFAEKHEPTEQPTKNKSQPTEQQSVEGQPSPAKEQKSTPQIGLTDLPPYIMKEIGEPLSPKDKTALFLTTKNPAFREGIFLDDLSKLALISSDPECQQLYKHLFGQTPQSAASFKAARKEAIESEDAKKAAEVEGRLRSVIRTLPNIQGEWEALPEGVRTLFGNIDSSKILSSPERFKDVLLAIRAHNLNIVGQKLGVLATEADLSTKTAFLEAAEITARWLNDEGQKVTSLFADSSEMTRLPIEITRLPNLTRLELQRNLLTSVPSEIGSLRKLTSLNLSKTMLTSLPPEIGNLGNLTYLNLNENLLTSLPSKIGNLGNLGELCLEENQLTSLPPEIGNLTKLMFLDLQHNQLASVPSEIGNLRKLEGLILEKNQLTSLPPEIGRLTKLRALDLSLNRLATIPLSVFDLQKLTGLYLRGNPCVGRLPLDKIEGLELRGCKVFL